MVICAICEICGSKIKKVFSKIIFFFWILAITFASLVDYSSISGAGLSKGFGTGFWLHLIAYFMAALLFILAFEKTQGSRLHS
jgi:hypothetical protein